MVSRGTHSSRFVGDYLKPAILSLLDLLGGVHLLSRLTEHIRGMPGFPIGAGAPGAENHALVRSIQRNEQLQADPAILVSDSLGTPPVELAYQWQRCDIDAIICLDVGGATGKTYGVREPDIGFRLRVEVTARNAMGSNSAFSSPWLVRMQACPWRCG
jgi:hypothetical protein